MDAVSLALAVNRSQRADGALSLRQLQMRLARSGHEELARAVRSLARHLAVVRQEEGPEIVPWF